MVELLTRPWPWYVAGPVIGTFPVILLLVGNRLFGVSSNLRHMCAAVLPRRIGYLDYDWRGSGLWNLTFALGILIGGFLAGVVLANPEPIAISGRTVADLQALGVRDFSGLVPNDLLGWGGAFSARGLVLLVGGGFLIGFGTAYAGGCTSGHGIAGLASLQLPSLLATASFFVGGILTSWFLLPLLL